MLKAFENNIGNHHLFTRKNKLLLAASGGVDSMVLASLLHDGKYNFALAHCNYQLRGEESDQDEAFVKDTAIVYRVPFFTKKMDVMAYQKDHSSSIQMAARELRYAWFNQLVTQHGFDYLLTAHHLNDSFETAIFNLVKGTGIAGLRGIKVKNGRVIRPLQTFSKEDIHAYAINNNLKWREDESNKSSKYARNLIRHSVIPQLKKLNPDLQGTFKLTAKKIGGAEKIIEHYFSNLAKEMLEYRDNHIHLNKDKLLKTPDPTFVLHHFISNYGFNFHQAEMILGTIKNSGKTIQSESHELVVDRMSLIISERLREKAEEGWINETATKVDINELKFNCSIAPYADYQLINDQHVAALDLDKLVFPLQVRKWEAGDKFIPLGMRHKKKLSDFMIDNKIPLNLKKRTMVIVAGNKIVWVVGHRIDDRFKLTTNSTRVFEIKINTND